MADPRIVEALLAQQAQFRGGTFGVPTVEEEALRSLFSPGTQGEQEWHERQVHGDPRLMRPYTSGRHELQRGLKFSAGSLPLLAMPDASTGNGWWTGQHQFGAPIPRADGSAPLYQTRRGPTLDAASIVPFESLKSNTFGR